MRTQKARFRMTIDVPIKIVHTGVSEEAARNDALKALTKGATPFFQALSDAGVKFNLVSSTLEIDT